MLVLTSNHAASEVSPEPHVRRTLPFGRGRRLDVARAPLRSLRAAREAGRVAQQFRPDLVFLWNGTQIPQTVLWKLERFGVPVAYRVCEHWFGRIYRTDEFLRFLQPGWTGVKRVWSAIARIVNRHPDLRVRLDSTAPVGVAWVSDALRKTTPRPENLTVVLETVIYIGVPRIDPSSTVRFDRLTIGVVGRISPEKGPDIAIEALHRLRTHYGVDADLVLAGPGDAQYVRELRDTVRQLDLDDHVRFLGRCQRSEAMQLVASLDALVVPSRWHEAFGAVASEAAALGTPLVAARSGGMPEQLPEDECALYFDIGDVEGCARALAQTLLEPESSELRAMRARDHAHAILSVPRELDRMSDFLNSIVDAHPTATVSH